MLFMGVSLAAIIAAFVLANSSYEFDVKTKCFSAIIVLFLMYCAIVFVGREEYQQWFGTRDEVGNNPSVDQKLYSIEEAAAYFGGSLKPADMFRLMASRINDLVPFDLCVLFMIDRAESRMRAVQADGKGAEKFYGIETDLKGGLAGFCLMSGSVQVDRGLNLRNDSIPPEALSQFSSAAALPLKRNGEAFSLLLLYSSSKAAFDGDKIELLEAVCERVTPMVLGSISFEQSLSNAMSDPITDLPNERAFFMIVENQLAESQRNREARPLSLLSVDIKHFSDINQRYGHAAGDRILSFAAKRIKDQLRQMDFVARASNDEFLVVLPTASENVAAEIVARIYTEFVSCRYPVNQEQNIQIDLNFGVSTFGKDGETVQTLLATARERKDQSKNAVPSKVIWFPKEYVN